MVDFPLKKFFFSHQRVFIIENLEIQIPSIKAKTHRVPCPLITIAGTLICIFYIFLSSTFSVHLYIYIYMYIKGFIL